MKRITLVIASLALLAAMAFADTKATTVWFNVPSDVTFSVTLPGQGATAGGATTDIEYNASVPTLNKINCSVREPGGVLQTDTVPCFNYTNTGNRAINITLVFDLAPPAGVTVKAGLNDSAWIASCACAELPTCNIDDCIEVDNAAAVTVATIAYAGYQEVWMWADYSGYGGGSSNQRGLTHESLSSS